MNILELKIGALQTSQNKITIAIFSITALTVSIKYDLTEIFTQDISPWVIDSVVCSPQENYTNRANAS
jgi:hypothetical protein